MPRSRSNRFGAVTGTFVVVGLQLEKHDEGGPLMEISLSSTEEPGVSAEQRRDLAKLVRKLRWIGMDEEADQLFLVLRRIDLTAALLAAHSTPTDGAPPS